MMVESGRGGGIPTASEGEEDCRENVGCFAAESDIRGIDLSIYWAS